MFLHTIAFGNALRGLLSKIRSFHASVPCVRPTTTEQKPAAKSGSTDTRDSATSGTKSSTQNVKPAEGSGNAATTQSGNASKQSTDQNSSTTSKSSSEINVNKAPNQE